MLLARLLVLLALGALASAPAAHAAWPGTPGKVAFLERDSGEFALKIWTPKGATGTSETVRDTFHVHTGAGDTVPPTTGMPSSPAWSPDGTRVAFAAKVPDTGLPAGATHTAIFVWNLRSKAITQITTPAPSVLDNPNDQVQTGYGYFDHSPAWSPDGKSLAYIRFLEAGRDDAKYGSRGGHVRTVSLTGGGSSQLTNMIGTSFWGLSWGGDPEGQTKLVGYHAAEGAGIRILSIDPSSGSTSTLLSGAPAAMVTDYDVSPDGQSLLYAHAGGEAYRLDFGGGTDTALGGGITSGWLRASPSGNGPLHIGMAPVPGFGQRGGIVERRMPDPWADTWAEDPPDRWVNGLLSMAGKYAHTVPGRSAFDVQPQRLPIVNIPGFAGSDIRCEGSDLWPPGLVNNGAKLQAMRLATDGKTNLNCPGAGPTPDPNDPEGFVSSAFGQDIYQAQEDWIEDIAPGDRGWRFSWDWRKAPGESIGRLHTFVGQILNTDFAKDQGLDRVVLYGHSYGGLLMREYTAKYPEKVGRVLTAGTPFWGAAKPLFFVAFGVENPLTGVKDLDSFLPNEDAKAWARDAAGLYHLFASDRFGPWLRVGGTEQTQEGVSNWFTQVAQANTALIAQARAWHQQYDGFDTRQGMIETRAVMGTGLMSIEGVDVAANADAGGTLEARVRLGDGDVTVPARSAHQGPVGTHKPLGDPVHVQAVCGVSHMELGGHPKVTEKYTEYLLSGRTPRRTEGACKPSGTSVQIVEGDLSPSRSALRSASAPTPRAAADAGLIQLVEVPRAPIAILDDRTPVDLTLAGPGQRVTLRVTRYVEGVEQGTSTYSDLPGDVRFTTGEGGTVAVTVGGTPVGPDGDDDDGNGDDDGNDDGGTGDGNAGTGGGSGSAGGATPTPAAPGAGSPARTAAKLRGGVLKVRGGRVRVSVTCAGPGRCRGVLRLRARRTVLGSAKVNVAAGGKATVAVRLSAAGRRALKRKGRVAATAQLDLGAGARTTAAVTVRR